MSDEKKYYGICTTCNHAHLCMHSQNSKRPVWFCEMFDDYVPPRELSSNSNKSQKKYNSKLESHYAQYKGLCMNCAKRDSCTFPKPEGGVWHCAEYQ